MVFGPWSALLDTQLCWKNNENGDHLRRRAVRNTFKIPVIFIKADIICGERRNVLKTKKIKMKR